ncbi:DUF2612 domain-containing protein [Pectinatus haikarae]|uniref:DUF2612 domain-containing protein n=1 Tax=Pectinatus haikarae TaxID=349096 RepID=A0ABT9Y5K1_9FIRM|nr:DUF2612 domain-containing protein [Pectinatus haikarae]MDQ0202467.1 hypothetical protein [Pectinatus haikarae]
MALIDNYKDLITSQHRGKPKYIATLGALLKHSEDICSCAIYLSDYFDLDLAMGKQEDILGIIIGANRTLNFQPNKGLSPVLDNFAYRNLLKAKIAQNMWKGGINDLKKLWNILFGSGIIIQDNQDMTIDIVTIGSNFDQITKNMIQQGLIIPKPLSVGVNYYFSDDAVFGYDMETATIKGYDEANWMDPDPKDSFSYDKNDDENKMHGYDIGYWT